MRGKIRHSLLGMALVAAVVAAPQTTTTAGAQGGWTGFTATSVPSGLTGGAANDSPAFTAAVTSDLAGSGVDLFVSNHAEASEWLTDWDAGVFANAIPAAGGFDTHGASFSDIDDDGDDDLIETSGRNHDTRVFKNNAGALSAITGHGLEDNAGRGRTVLMVDIDDDGDMDALIVNLDRTLISEDAPPAPDGAQPSELYLNDGDGTSWTKVADPTGVIDDGSIRFAHLTSTGPATEQIIITSNSFQVAAQSIQTGTATLISALNPANTSQFAGHNATNLRDIALGDLNGDLSPEFVVARQDDFLATDDFGATAPAPDDPATPEDESLTETVDIGDGTPDLLGLRPLGIGQVTSSSLVSKVIASISGDLRVDNCRTIALADYDNDADLDIFGGCAMVESGQTQNVVLLNDGVGNFTIGDSALVPATAAGGTATVAINADFNNDGWIDTYVGGGYDSQKGEDFIFLNQGGTSNHWLELELDGSNPDAAGAQVFLGSNKWQVRESGHRVHRGQDMKTLHFGLGSQTAVAPLEIMWPDGTFERCAVSGIDQKITITQGSADCVDQTKSGLLAAIATTPDTSPLVPPAVCNGLEVTVDLALNDVPTEGDDVIRGTSGPDVINALGGNDTICSLQGDDTINGGDGFDKVFAGQGNDTINGGSGNDKLVGGAGKDTIMGGNGNDRIQGGEGADVLHGENGLDRIAGASGNDILRGGKFADELLGGLGRDDLFGDEGDDVLRGGAWIDTMDGGSQKDGCTLNDPSGNPEIRINCETGVFGL